MNYSYNLYDEIEEIQCGVCRENWTVVRLCPNCWIELLEEHEGDDEWSCTVCGTYIAIKVMNFYDQERIVAIICVECKVIYVPM